MPEYAMFFREYAKAYERSLGESVRREMAVYRQHGLVDETGQPA